MRIEKRERLLSLIYAAGTPQNDTTVILDHNFIGSRTNLINELISDLKNRVDWVVVVDNGETIIIKDAPGKSYMKFAIKRTFLGREHKRSLKNILKYLYSDITIATFAEFMTNYHTKGDEFAPAIHFDNSLDAREYSKWLFDIFKIKSIVNNNEVVITESKEEKHGSKKEKIC